MGYGGIRDGMMNMYYSDPQNEDLVVACTCSECKKNIYVGDTYFPIRDEDFCEECIQELKREAEMPDRDYY